MTRIFLTIGTSSWTVPTDWNGSNNTIEAVGGGGGSYSQLNTPGGGGGGGAYAKIENLALTPGSIVNVSIGQRGLGSNGGNGGDTQFKDGATLLAKGGSGTGNSSWATGAIGGQSVSCIGTTKYSGGNGGNSAGSLASGGGGGGGAAGPNGIGANGQSATSATHGGNGGAADVASGGIGGAGNANGNGGNGGAGAQWDATHGTGGGGGGAGSPGFTFGGTGGAYGGGAGGGLTGQTDGGAGLIVITYTPVTPSSSSSTAGLSALISRQCRRLAEPQSTTLEQTTTAGLQITVTLPILIVNQYVALIPNTGPDVLVVNYTDSLGQPQQFTRNVTFWCSEYGYVFLGTDQKTQLLIASVNPGFWQSNAPNINARNGGLGTSPLLPCTNPSRYDANVLIAGQQVPTLFIYNGQTLANPSSSSSSH